METRTAAPLRPGPRNALTDVAGLAVGCAEDAAVRTGVTVILPEESAVCAVDVRGGGPGTRETDLLAADTLVEKVDALVLAGGSAYGLAAADGVAAALGAAGRGFSLVPRPGVPPTPIVPAAILYDLANGGDKSWGAAPPYERLGRQALETIGETVPLGDAGAGYGAMAGQLKGGQGTASIKLSDGGTVAALAAVNSFGSVLMPGTDCFWASPFEIDGEFGGVRPKKDIPPASGLPDDTKLGAGPRENTTIACVATDIGLAPAEAKRVAIMAQDGLSRAIRPCHAPTDGDVVFCLSTGARPMEGSAALAVLQIGNAAADCLARAIAR
ncbi:MAG: P1 family peptidase, partial [Pseudomonadota bacterium]